LMERERGGTHIHTYIHIHTHTHTHTHARTHARPPAHTHKDRDSRAAALSGIVAPKFFDHVQ
jgi:hypothetical protein